MGKEQHCAQEAGALRWSKELKEVYREGELKVSGVREAELKELCCALFSIENKGQMQD